jgi:hypothetical protein
MLILGYGYNEKDLVNVRKNMPGNNLFTKEVIQEIKTAQKARILQSVQVGKTKKQNELVFFIKPELFDVDQDQAIYNSLQLLKEKFTSYEVEINGAAIIPGAVLEQHSIMNRHYGFINQLSRKASELVNADIRQQIFSALGIPDTGEYEIMGGHEFLENFNSDIDTLSDVWFAQEANKLRSGFYFIEDTFENEPIILVNGFHPSQLAHFTRVDHRIFLMLLHTDTDWMKLKFDLVGDTFPERAKKESIRGQLYANPERFGQSEVTINTNGVHLSAGPFESAFEVVNFFGPLLEIDPVKTPPLAIKKAILAGIPENKAVALLDNPDINDSDLFSETENLNTDEAVQMAINLISSD